MKSPFPGLDPYLEPFWSNVHTSMTTYIRDYLQSELPDGLWAQVEESVTIAAPQNAAKRPRVFPDIHVTDRQPWRPVWNEAVGGLAVAEPLVIPDDEPLTLRHIEIVDTKSGGEVITAIEVLSPANKVGSVQRHEYRSKQQSFVRALVNLVEIDLIRAGGYNLAAPVDRISEDKLNGYLISVYRASSFPREWERYPVSRRERLPAFRIPLRTEDADIALDLQAILDQCYQKGGYHLGIDYSGEPSPPLPEADRAWMDELLREKGLR